MSDDSVNKIMSDFLTCLCVAGGMMSVVTFISTLKSSKIGAVRSSIAIELLETIKVRDADVHREAVKNSRLNMSCIKAPHINNVFCLKSENLMSIRSELFNRMPKGPAIY